MTLSVRIAAMSGRSDLDLSDRRVEVAKVRAKGHHDRHWTNSMGLWSGSATQAAREPVELEPAPWDVREASQALSPGREEVRY